MVIPLEEREYIIANYESSGRLTSRLREMFKERFDYFVSKQTIGKIWREHGFELSRPGGWRGKSRGPSLFKIHSPIISPLEKYAACIEHRMKLNL